MYDRVAQVHNAILVARGKVLLALSTVASESDCTDVARHLTCLNYALMSAEFVAAEAENAALAVKVIRAHYRPTDAGGESGSES